MYIFPLILVLIILAFVGIMIIRHSHTCPEGKILVIYGKVGLGRPFVFKREGRTFVLPLVQGYQYLDLAPFNLGVDLRGAMTNNALRVNLSATFTVSITEHEKFLPNAAERLLGLSLSNVINTAQEIILGQMRHTIAICDIEDLVDKTDTIFDYIQDNIDSELCKVGLHLHKAQFEKLTDDNGVLDSIRKKLKEKHINETINNTNNITNNPHSLSDLEKQMIDDFQNELIDFMNETIAAFELKLDALKSQKTLETNEQSVHTTLQTLEPPTQPTPDYSMGLSSSSDLT